MIKVTAGENNSVEITFPDLPKGVQNCLLISLRDFDADDLEDALQSGDTVEPYVNMSWRKK